METIIVWAMMFIAVAFAVIAWRVQ